MCKPLTTCALVPAKLTSVRVPRKNLIKLGEKELFKFSVDAAKSADLIDDIFVSTESDEVADLVDLEDCYLIRRPEYLSEPSVPNIDVILHALDEMEEAIGRVPDLLVLLQPSHPFRNPEELNEAIQQMIDNEDASSLVSVAPVGKVTSCVENGRWVDANKLGPGGKKGQKVAYANRGSFTIFRTKFFDGSSIYGETVLAYELKNPELDVDIDEPWDFEQAKFTFQNHTLIEDYS